MNALVHTSEYGRSHSIKCSGADINALTGIKTAVDKCLFVLYWRWMHHRVQVALQTKFNST